MSPPTLQTDQSPFTESGHVPPQRDFGPVAALGSWLDAQETMTRDTYSDITIESSVDFQAALSALVESAVLNDVDVRGAWDFQTDGSTHNWEVEIVELANDEGDDD